jgi:uncharacterized alpha-E superfamily protein
MLSRVADALFWMSRYVERAEHVARLLDVCFHQELDLRGVMAAPYELEWTSLVAILQQQQPPASVNGVSPHSTIGHWLTFDLNNPNSILSCVAAARNNARHIRGAINSVMWRELNKLYWQLRDPEFSHRARESPHDFYQAVECGSHIFQGVCDATLTHDEGWQFLRLGKFLERADKTLLILDVKFHRLRDEINPADLPLSNLQWAGVLRSCLAYEAYQRLYVGRVEPVRVVEFLLLHPEFPRSVRFALESAADALAAIEGTSARHGEGRTDRLLGRVLSDLRYAELDLVLKGDLHAFLGSVRERCSRVSLAVQQQYSLQS